MTDSKHDYRASGEGYGRQLSIGNWREGEYGKESREWINRLCAASRAVCVNHRQRVASSKGGAREYGRNRSYGQAEAGRDTGREYGKGENYRSASDKVG